MDYWQIPAFAAAILILGTIGYVVARWRKAPHAFKAIMRVAVISFTAGALLGVSGLHFWRRWTVNERFAPIAYPKPTPANTRATPTRLTSAPHVSAGETSSILASYVGEALAQSDAKDRALGRFESWLQLDQGCRLGNYDRAGILCQAASLATHGWGSTNLLGYNQIVKFCDAGYLNKDLDLCRNADRFSGRSVPAIDGEPTATGYKETDGIREADVVREFGSFPLFRGPNGNLESWPRVLPACTTGAYAPASPICRAAQIQSERASGARSIPFSEVASFCDIKLIDRQSEVCRAAYRLSGAEGVSAR